jgi:hypothetical protein
MAARHLIFLGAALLLATPAAGQMVSARDPKAIAALLQDKGYKAELVEEKDGPMIHTGASGVKFTIFFMNCAEAKDCRTVQFYAGFTDMGDVSLARVNEWNKQHRFGRGYIDDEKDPVIEMDVDLDHKGIPAENFLEYLDVFSSLAPKYREFVQQK